MLLLGIKNVAPQTLSTDGIVNLGSVYRRYDKKSCGTRAFNFESTSLSLMQQGIYHITINLTITGTAAGVATFQLFENGVAIAGATASETITLPTTETRNLTLDYFILVDNQYILDQVTREIKTLSLVNTGIGTTITNIVTNVER